jgi:uncharacterized membrane protein
MPLNPVYIFLVFLGFGGFLLAFYIHHHKKTGTAPLVCPLKAHCDTVIHSDYSRVMGIPVENLGMLYYALIAVSYGWVLVFPEFYLPMVASLLLTVTLFAFMFSVYLTLLQAFVIKNWCTWCLISAGICLTIFSIAASNSPFLAPLFSSIILGF